MSGSLREGVPAPPRSCLTMLGSRATCFWFRLRGWLLLLRFAGEELPIFDANEQARLRLAFVLPLIELQLAFDANRNLASDVLGERFSALAPDIEINGDQALNGFTVGFADRLVVNETRARHRGITGFAGFGSLGDVTCQLDRVLCEHGLITFRVYVLRFDRERISALKLRSNYSVLLNIFNGKQRK